MVIDVQKINSVTIALENKKLLTDPQTYIASVREFTKKTTIDQVSCIKFFHQINIYGIGNLFWCSLKSP